MRTKRRLATVALVVLFFFAAQGVTPVAAQDWMIYVTDKDVTTVGGLVAEGARVVKHTDGNWYAATATGTADTTRQVPGGAVTVDFIDTIDEQNEHYSFHIGANNTALLAPGWNGGIAVGIGNTSLGERALAVGRDSQALEYEAVAVGVGNTSLGWRSLAAGARAQALGKRSVSLGAETVAGGVGGTSVDDGQVAIGDRAEATGPIGSIAIGGRVPKATGRSAIAIGGSAKAYSDVSIALGPSTVAGESSRPYDTRYA
ncbi:MAG TPA: hypothetical protein DIC53_06740, partial [Synergistaceae bacterium]|nr:hypothetical protein [Synergistaceae bacterium]